MPPETECHTPISNDESLLPVLRSLTECYLQVNRTSTRAIESMGLTRAQFDVIVTLGDTDGMTCKELGERTFITKGTLTPVLDRLDSKGLIVRTKGQQDSRQTYVSLSDEGQRLYEATFMRFVNDMKPRFEILEPQEEQYLILLLQKLKTGFS